MFRIRDRLLRLRLKGLAEKQHRETLNAIRLSSRPVEEILFLCFGNICRSPVAEKLAKALLPKMAAASAGFYDKEGRSTPTDIQVVAQSLGIDLSNWASRRVTREMVRRSDLVILMDLQNFRDFRREFPSEQKKVVFLGLLLDPPRLTIADPYDKTAVEIISVIRQIEAGVGALANYISSGR